MFKRVLYRVSFLCNVKIIRAQSKLSSSTVVAVVVGPSRARESVISSYVTSEAAVDLSVEVLLVTVGRDVDRGIGRHRGRANDVHVTAVHWTGYWWGRDTKRGWEQTVERSGVPGHAGPAADHGPLVSWFPPDSESAPLPQQLLRRRARSITLDSEVMRLLTIEPHCICNSTIIVHQ